MTMYQSNVLKVCDYVTLYLSDGKTDADDVTKPSLYRWAIPQGAYMSNERSQVCTVELTAGTLTT